jgi:hypothetical protein
MCDECLNGEGHVVTIRNIGDKPMDIKKDLEPKSRNGSPTFYQLLETMAELHDRKSHDYASNDNPSGNYHFAGMLSKLFDNPDDAGFIGRIGEKLYRLANLENGGKIAKNEAIADTELDICVIVALWMADRLDRRFTARTEYLDNILNSEGEPRLKYDGLNKEGPEPVDPNPSRNTVCYFCRGETSNLFPKIISGHYRQAHISCFLKCEMEDNLRFEQFKTPDR